MQVFLFSPTPITCQCLSLAKPSQKPLSQEAGKHSLQRSTSQGAVSIERQSWRRVKNASKQDVEIISLLFCFPGQWATWEQGTYSPLWHQGPSCAQWLWQIFHRPPCRRFYIPPTAKWLAVPPCGRNVSPLSINIRFHHVTCFGQWMWAYQVPTEALRVFVWLRHLRLDLRVAWHGQSCSWLAAGM